MDQEWNWRENQALARRLKSAKLRHNACIEDIDYRAARGSETKLMIISRKRYIFLEARVGIEPTNKGFADLVASVQ